MTFTSTAGAAVATRAMAEAAIIFNMFLIFSYLYCCWCFQVDLKFSEFGSSEICQILQILRLSKTKKNKTVKVKKNFRILKSISTVRKAVVSWYGYWILVQLSTRGTTPSCTAPRKASCVAYLVSIYPDNIIREREIDRLCIIRLYKAKDFESVRGY